MIYERPFTAGGRPMVFHLDVEVLPVQKNNPLAIFYGTGWQVTPKGLAVYVKPLLARLYLRHGPGCDCTAEELTALLRDWCRFLEHDGRMRITQLEVRPGA